MRAEGVEGEGREGRRWFTQQDCYFFPWLIRERNGEWNLKGRGRRGSTGEDTTGAVLPLYISIYFGFLDYSIFQHCHGPLRTISKGATVRLKNDYKILTLN